MEIILDYRVLGLILTVAVVLGTLIYKFATWKNSVDNDRHNFHEFMREVRSDIKKIFDRLPPETTRSSSPIGLTDLGENVSKEIAAKSWAQSHAQKLFETAEGKDPLEIQELAFNYAKEFKAPEELTKKMRLSAFEHGVDLGKIRDVLGVELRNVLLDRQRN
jgi:hypothetical protein